MLRSHSLLLTAGLLGSLTLGLLGTSACTLEAPLSAQAAQKKGGAASDKAEGAAAAEKDATKDSAAGEAKAPAQESAKPAEKPAELTGEALAKAIAEEKAARSDANLDKPVGDHVHEYKDLAYVEATDGKPVDSGLKLDIYRPKNDKGDVKSDLPVVVFIHGGAWVMRDKRDGKALARALCPRDVLVISIGYRLVDQMDPDTRFPRFVKDAAKAVAWINKNVKDYGGDASRMYLSGHSAGGHIASLVATSPEYLKEHELDATTLFKGLISISGVYITPTVKEEPQAWMLDAVIAPDEETRKKASPIHHIDSKDLPMLLITAEVELPFGKLKEQATTFKAKLEELKVDVAHIEMKARSHDSVLRWLGIYGDELVEHVMSFIADAPKAIEEINAAQKKAAGEDADGSTDSSTESGDDKKTAEKPAPAGEKAAG